jgi:hypothetical protein
LTFLLTACNLGLETRGVPTIPPGQAAGATLAALLGTQQASQPVFPPTAMPSGTPPPAAPVASATSAPPSPAPTVGCTDRAGFVADVTVPDGTLFSAGTTFTKTWRLKNAGTCTWTSRYALVFFSGDQMSAPSVIAFAADVPPGAGVDVSANLDAPASSGYYQGNWKLRNNAGVLFGTGASGTSNFWVKIRVGPPSSSATPPV